MQSRQNDVDPMAHIRTGPRQYNSVVGLLVYQGALLMVAMACNKSQPLGQLLIVAVAVSFADQKRTTRDNHQQLQARRDAAAAVNEAGNKRELRKGADINAADPEPDRAALHLAAI